MTITPHNFATQIKKFCIKQDDSPNSGKLDYVFVVSGITGLGKSTLSTHIGRAYDPTYSYDKNLIYSRSDLLKKMSDCTNGSYLHVDEAINLVYRRLFYDKEQIGLLQDMDTYRNKHHCYALLVPNFWDLDEKLLTSTKIKAWIWVVEWGKGYIFRPVYHAFQKDPWNFKVNAKLFSAGWHKGMHPNESPNYLDTIEWDELAPDDFAEYEKVKAEKRQAAREERVDKVELSLKQKKVLRVRDKLIHLCARYDIKQREVAEAAEVDETTLSRILKKPLLKILA